MANRIYHAVYVCMIVMYVYTVYTYILYLYIFLCVKIAMCKT